MIKLPKKFEHLYNKKTYIKLLCLLLCTWTYIIMTSMVKIFAIINGIYILYSDDNQNPKIKEINTMIYKYTESILAYLTFQRKDPPYPFNWFI